LPKIAQKFGTVESGRIGVLDWTGCDLVEVDPEKVAGQPVVRGTRVPADVVLIDDEYGRTPEQTQASFPTLNIQAIRALLAFASQSRS
jgi:uncharacterized protein (DUF433 family)